MKANAKTNPMPFYAHIGAPRPMWARPSASCQGMDIFATSSDGRWLLVYYDRGGRHWWVKTEDVEQVTSPTPAPQPKRKCLVGIHGRADGRMTGADNRLIALAKFEAVKLLSTAAPEDVDALRAINPGMFIVVRLYADLSRRRATPDDFCSWVVDDIRRFYEKGVLWYEVHNEPNLKSEGMWLSWASGREFGDWFIGVRDNLRRSFPDALFGYPGLSPNGIPAPDLRADDLEFLKQSEHAVNAADWLGAHCYWVDRAQLEGMDGGMRWMRYYARHPHKPLVITECSNPSPEVPGREKAVQYVDYLSRLSTPVASFFFCSSASASAFRHEVFLDETGGLTELGAHFVSRRLKA